MLFILRKIRKSFFLPGKLRTYLAYAAGEILLIIVGILIALEWSTGPRFLTFAVPLVVAAIAAFAINARELAVQKN